MYILYRVKSRSDYFVLGTFNSLSEAKLSANLLGINSKTFIVCLNESKVCYYNEKGWQLYSADMEAYKRKTVLN